MAAVPSHLLYAKNEDGNLLNPHVFLAMLIASVTSFLVFSLAKKIPFFLVQIIVGIGVSYLAFLGVIFLIAAITDEMAETIMWMPIMILVGIPNMAPLVGLSWLGSTLIFGMKKE
jgi:hypothetical protein